MLQAEMVVKIESTCQKNQIVGVVEIFFYLIPVVHPYKPFSKTVFMTS